MKTNLLRTLAGFIILLVLSVHVSQKAFAVCNVPSGLNAANVTINSASLSWTATGAQAYSVRFRSTAITSWIPLITNTNSIQLNYLLSNIPYEWQVSSLCITNHRVERSAWSASSFFTTLPSISCPVPTALQTPSVTTTTASLTWTSTGANAYNIHYRKSTSLNWLNRFSGTNSVTLFGLLPNTNYDWEVQSICIAANSATVSGYSATATFTTGLLRVAYNPGHGLSITSETETGPVTITVFNMQGSLVIKKDLARLTNFNDIEMPELSRGIYAVNFSSLTDNFTEKIFVE